MKNRKILAHIICFIIMFIWFIIAQVELGSRHGGGIIPIFILIVILKYLWEWISGEKLFSPPKNKKD